MPLDSYGRPANIAMYKWHDPHEKLTRGEWFAEILEGWEDSLRVAKKLHYYGLVGMLLSAIEVLKTSYEPSELMDFDKLEKELACQPQTLET